MSSLQPVISLVQKDFDAVSTLMGEALHDNIKLIDELCHHILDSGGKRIRPLLLLLVAKACDYRGEHHIQMGAAIEYFHTATLLHDDVVDDSSLRRGKATAHEAFGSKASILVGDYLFTQAMQFTVKLDQHDVNQVMADTALEITQCEIQQLSNRHNPDVSIDDYFAVIRGKTAILFAAAAKIGAQLAKMPLKIQEAFYQFGLHIGNAFQMIDDALDYGSKADVIGKNIGDDLNEGKPTLPLIHALKQGTPPQQALIRKAITQGTLEDLTGILQALQETRALETTQELAYDQVELALEALESTDLQNPHIEALKTLAQFSVNRQN